MPSPTPERRPVDLTALDQSAASVQETDDYFRILRRELEDALREGVILIERQQVTLI
jgi:hypothetical protein